MVNHLFVSKSTSTGPNWSRESTQCHQTLSRDFENIFNVRNFCGKQTNYLKQTNSKKKSKKNLGFTDIHGCQIFSTNNVMYRIYPQMCFLDPKDHIWYHIWHISAILAGEKIWKFCSKIENFASLREKSKNEQNMKNFHFS